ncbi:MAG TPA: hypothetical protein DCS93_19790 [Microscillaceae bacterium]|nr:hypothetical protein [Microscillaceae bacterium]
MKTLLTFLLILVGCFQSFAQRGYSSASFAMGKQRSNHLIIPKPSEIVLEEFFNYHTHNLTQPNRGYNVGLDLRWGNPYINHQQNEALLQVGFTTHKNSHFVDNTPLNICLVIDRSSSMSGQRIAHARQSALTLLKKLRPQDRMSIVTFDHEVQVLLKHEPAGNKRKIGQIIRSIATRGSTDLNSGLIKGYELIAQQYRENANNKVLMLTDVLTNTGQIDIEAIVKNAHNYSKNHQIGITMVAIGVQVNDALARQITSSGQHTFHYINDSEDIQKVFVDEVESIFSTIAKDVSLTLEFDRNLNLQEFYGYAPSIGNNKITLQLNNMNAGLTQVVLAKFKASQLSGKVLATLSYFDVEKKSRVTQQQTIRLYNHPRGWLDMLSDLEVKKCVSIAEMANCLKKMAIQLDKPSPQKADFMQVKDMLEIQIKDIKRRYQQKVDNDVQRVLAMLEKYARAIRPLAK